MITMLKYSYKLVFNNILIYKQSKKHKAQVNPCVIRLVVRMYSYEYK